MTNDELSEDEAPTGLGRVVDRAGDLSKLLIHQATLAKTITYSIVILGLALILCATFGPASSHETLREVAAITFPPLVALAGTSFAWFYATRDAGPKSLSKNVATKAAPDTDGSAGSEP